MKNFSKTIASISLSLLTIGAMAQFSIQEPVHLTAMKLSAAELKYIQPSQNSKNNNKVGGVSGANGLIDYIAGDASYASTSLGRWNKGAYMNMRYNITDTVYSPLDANQDTAKNANNMLLHSVSVAYDTLYDFYDGGGFYGNILPGSVSVDTITAFMGYHNTSGTNDTIILQVASVNSKGLPTSTTVYGSDTIIIGGTSFTYNVYDSVQPVSFNLKSPITIPSSARRGWNFCINMIVYGSKLDTVGVWYYSQAQNCTAGSSNPARTAMGVVDGAAKAVNSFTIGNQWYNSNVNGGNGAVVTFPNYSGNVGPGSVYGECGISDGAYFYGFRVPAGCGDTSYYPVQDLGILPSIVFSGSPAGINNVSNASGLSVDQNYPNPFNKQTKINYSLTKSSSVIFTVYDITGRVIMNNNYTTVAPGQHEINLSANSFSPGIYFYTFNVNGNTVTKKMVITN